MLTRFLIGTGLAFALVFIAGIAAILSVTQDADRIGTVTTPASAVNGSVPVAEATPNLHMPNPRAVAQVSVPAINAASTVPCPVFDSDLAKLAAAVKLSPLSTGDVSKDVWIREVPIAQKLLTGMCDCDQRNWLKHFVETGQEAIAGSNHYPESIQLLATLRRGNSDLTISSQASR
jgi:hypothetical protein